MYVWKYVKSYPEPANSKKSKSCSSIVHTYPIILYFENLITKQIINKLLLVFDFPSQFIDLDFLIICMFNLNICDFNNEIQV